MEILKKLVNAYGPSGREDIIRELIKDEITPYVDEVYTDTLGNLIAHKKGSGKKIMLVAHMDEIGICVTYIEDNGFLRFCAVGGLYEKDLNARKIIFKNGIVGVIGIDEDNKDKKITKMFIDIGTKSREETEKIISIGDMAVFCGDFVQQNDILISKAMDNRAGCYVLIESIKNIKSQNDLYFVFTVQEEVGLRGAKTSAFGIMPDYAIAVDVTDVGDTPENIKIDTKLGGGACIKVMDKSVLCDSFVRSLLIELAKSNKIDYQLEVLTVGGTDAGAISLTGAGVRTGGVSIPTRYIHSPSEMISKKDLQDCISLLTVFMNYKFD